MHKIELEHRPEPPGDMTLATVHYDIVGLPGTVVLEYSQGYVYNSVGLPLVECLEDGTTTEGLCLEATVEVVAAAGDNDGDGVSNAADNCIGRELHQQRAELRRG
jgi:hypothetical protein